MDSFWERRQLCVHLEPADEGDCTEAAGAHRRGPVHRLPSHREHYCLRQPRQ